MTNEERRKRLQRILDERDQIAKHLPESGDAVRQIGTHLQDTSDAFRALTAVPAGGWAA